MPGRGVDPRRPRRRMEQGEYVVDSREVAEAIVRSWMLVAAEPRHRAVGPRRTRPRPADASPIQVSGTAASAASRRSGGTVKSSS